MSTSEFEDWIRPHWRLMRILAQRFAPGERDDVLQEALAEAWAHRSRYDPARGNARVWLLAITANQARKAARRRGRPDPRLGLAPSQGDGLDRLDLERAISSLSVRQRLAVELHYFADLPVDEVAKVMGCRAGTVKSTLSTARSKIRSQLGDDYR